MYKQRQKRQQFRRQQNNLKALVPVLGTNFINSIDDPNLERRPLRVGTTTYTKHQLATRLGVTHVAAARRLTAIADAMKARSVRDLYERSTPYAFASTPGIGPTTLYVAWRLFEIEGFDALAWYERGQEEAENVVNFLSLKQRSKRVTKEPSRTGRAQQPEQHQAAAL